jgi:hypothetical protein
MTESNVWIFTSTVFTDAAICVTRDLRLIEVDRNCLVDTVIARVTDISDDPGEKLVLEVEAVVLDVGQLVVAGDYETAVDDGVRC